MTSSFYDDTSALIVAAGDGTRLGGQPKALVTVGGMTLIERVTQNLREFSSQIIVGVRPADVSHIRAILPAEVDVVPGGATRQETVQHLLAKARKQMVLIHDVARPFTSQALFKSVLESAFRYGGATPVLPATKSDSIALSDGEWLGDPLPRDKVVLTQTPYAFERQSVVEAMRQAEESSWEDTTITALMTRAGYRVRLVPGEAINSKITYPEDLLAACEFFDQDQS